MNSLWNDNEARDFADDPLAMRVYTSRLLGKDPDLVLHGGGNTSVKVAETDLFGESDELLYVKGSGWDLATIEAPGFAPVRMEVLLKMAALEKLSDSEMVRVQRSAMTDPSAPNPSVEAILHAIIPSQYVDHTHADAVVTITNTPGGKDRIREIYGDRLLVVPYVMPGFILAKKIYDMTRDMDWAACGGMILMNHGVFTFDDDPKASYEKMIHIVTEAEAYLAESAGAVVADDARAPRDLDALARLRQAVSQAAGHPMIAKLDQDAASIGFANRSDAADISSRGPLTPDHIIRTKRRAVVIGDDPSQNVADSAAEYRAYFERNKTDGMHCLDPAPRWAIWPGHGIVTFGKQLQETTIVSDIKDHTIRAIQLAEALGGWTPLPEAELFEMEYWELEQAKLKKAGAAQPVFRGRIALVTGAASGIGRACAEELHARGAVVAALDIDPAVTGLFPGPEIRGFVCDVTDADSVKTAVAETVHCFGGLDIVVSNAGIFPLSATIEAMPDDTWSASLAVNLTSHRLLLRETIPYLRLGADPAIIIVASKNVAAPGPGAAAYSVAKSGLTQLARVAALELAGDGIRVNVVHPNAVFDTAIWTDEVLAKRAEHYGLSVPEYRTNNLLKVEVTSKDVAALACEMAGPTFAKTTGAQIPIDGGNDRVV